MDEQSLRSYLAEWRKAEDRFFGAALSVPELYTAGVELVRGIANYLDDIKLGGGAAGGLSANDDKTGGRDRRLT